MSHLNYLRELIRTIPDFPKPGILFYDITTLVKDAKGLQLATEALATPFLDKPIDCVVGIEARGFIFAALVAYRLGVGFIPIRKPDKLPAKVTRASYPMEYGQQTLEMHRDAFTPGSRVLIVDDLLATGGTMQAGIEMIHTLQGEIVGLTFLIELEALQAKSKLGPYLVHSVLKF